MNKLREYGYRDVNLEGYLLHDNVKEHISIIEGILNKDSQELTRLQILKEDNKLDFGNVLSKKELKETFPNICTDVNKFLKIEEMNLPDFGYPTIFKVNKATSLIFLAYGFACMQIIPQIEHIFKGQLNQDALWPILVGSLALIPSIRFHRRYTDKSIAGYYANLSEIVFSKEPKANLVAIAAHEYTHHIQNRRGLMNGTSEEIFVEGHARSIQKEIAKSYAEKEDNEAIYYSSLDHNVGELKSAYRWLCNKNQLQLNQHLLKTPTTRDMTELSYYMADGKPTPHAIGNALFTTCEAKYGKEIYTKVLNGEFRFENYE